MNIKPFLLERHFAKYEFGVPYQLSCSDCEPFVLNELLMMASPDSRTMWDNLRFAYTVTSGHPLLRKEISEMEGNIRPEEVLICVPGEGIFLVMSSLLDPGDHLVVISPAYQSLYEIAASLKCRVSPWNADESGNYKVETLRSLSTRKTRMVVINFPHNPSGAHITQDDLEGIVRFCDAAGILLFSDEMYRGLEQDPADHLTSAASLSTNAISLSGMSKSFALPGLRIGWLITRSGEIYSRLLQLKDYTTICSSAPSEILALIALQNRQQILARNVGIIRHNINLVNEFVNKHQGAYGWAQPRAGSVALLNILNDYPVEKLCQDLLDQKGVLAIGSYLFNSEKPSIRLGLGRTGFPEALAKVDEWLRTK